MMKRTSIATALLLSSSFTMANTISGRVIDQMGNPVTKGDVQVMGSNKRVAIGSDGTFSFTNVKLGKVELHVGSPDYIHSSTPVVVLEGGIAGLNITVTSSSIEVFDVTASAFHASNIESAAPVTVLAGEKLNNRQAATLGDTLRNEVGVHSSFHGGVASTPIIRGLDGPRVLITQNGMDASDASRVGPDHMVATDTSSAQQIEVLRGPATLFYGSGAIGGVVNVVDQRIPDNNDAEGEFVISRNTVNAEEGVSGFIKGGKNNFAFNAQGFYRDADNYRIPGFAESEDAHDDHDEHDGEHDEDHDDEHELGSEGVVESSQYRSKGFTLGSSYLFEQGHVGLSVQHLSSLYGIPGHAHSDEHDEHEDDMHDDLDEMHGDEEEMVVADLKQNRYQLAGEFQLSSEAISAINFGMSYTDYTHVEIENGEPGTRFTNNSFETRIEVLHQPIAGWRGGVSLHTKLSDFSAIGEEAFTPASDTRSFGLGIIEEKHFGDVLVQLGGRIERVEIDVPRIFAPDLEVHEHDDDHMDEHMDDHMDDDHDHEHSDIDSVAVDFTPYSLSAGAVWDFAEGYNIGLSYVHAQRAPSAAELFSFGPHIGTQTYEIGALYQLEGDEFEIGIGEFELETSNNFDISLRKFAGDFGFVVNVFYNQVDDYYYGADTGLFAEFSHDHDDEHSDEHGDEHGDDHDDHGDEHEGEHSDEHSDELPVFAFVNSDATLYGAEFQFNWKATETLTFFTQGDIIKTDVDTDRGSESLPRTPPARLTFGGEFSNQNWLIDAQIMRVMRQSDIAEFESATDGYTMIDANISYFTSIQGYDLEIFAKGRNLGDEEARVHTSFLRDLAPLPGRSVLFGVRATF
ncbi:TonB-dependent receptor [Glaciecola sp. SC05]|uniref:TonB-dependent receptor n=1 Tax=Glaciecola sp. SC05 TaxID=1987355 RepID=UPI0035272431